MTINTDTIAIEDAHMPPFFKKTPISITHGKGIFVWDENGKKYLDFTSGWGVTCLGHAHPAIVSALTEQGGKIMQNPNSGLTYSPARAKLLQIMAGILPGDLTRIFFCNSGAEANDAAIKLARKVTGRSDIISTHQSFHGRTISTVSATGQEKHRARFNPLVPGYRFVPYNDLTALAKHLDNKVAAVIIEPIQGEGGINIPSADYLSEVSSLCEKNGSGLIIDEIQTGIFRTGRPFAITGYNVKPDFLTIGKGIAGGFPFAAFAVSERVSQKIERGDHGGTYCGNPLGCAVSYAAISTLLDMNVSENVKAIGGLVLDAMQQWQRKYGNVVLDVRGEGLLWAASLASPEIADEINATCMDEGLLINIVQGNMLRIFPALNITREEADQGLRIIEDAIAKATEKAR